MFAVVISFYCSLPSALSFGIDCNGDVPFRLYPQIPSTKPSRSRRCGAIQRIYYDKYIVGELSLLRT